MNRLFGTHMPATALRAVPPTCGAFSSTITLAPNSWAWSAVVNPAIDPPTMTRSASRSQSTPSAFSGARTCGFAIFALLDRRWISRRRAVSQRGAADGIYDRVVASATTQIAADRRPDLRVSRVRDSVEQVLRGEEHAGEAEPALE